MSGIRQRPPSPQAHRPPFLSALSAGPVRLAALPVRPLRLAAFVVACTALVLPGTALLLPATAEAQLLPEIPPPSDTLYEVRLADGTLIVGHITEVDAERVVITTRGGGRFEIGRTQVWTIRPAEGRFVRGEYWHEDPGVTRLFFTSTGRTLAAGESYVGTYVVFLPFAAIGVTDHVTITAGAPVLAGELKPFYAGPKIQVFSTPTAQASVGALAFFFDDEMIGVAYGVGTFGDSDNAFSAGLGYFFTGEEVVHEPALMFGGETRIGRRIKLISENYILPDAVGFVWSGGTRIIGDRFNTEVGIMGVTAGDEAFCCLPLINFSYAFGR